MLITSNELVQKKVTITTAVLQGPCYFYYPALSPRLVGKHPTEALQIFYLIGYADTETEVQRFIVI